MTVSPPRRPTGRDEIRTAVLAAAARHFAAHGTSASLRDIADDAQVNVGLIHRHFGNKDELLKAVLGAQTTAGAAFVATTLDPAVAVRHIFEQSKDSPYIRTLAWLLLADERAEQFQDHYPTIDALRRKLRTEEQQLGLLASFAIIYGWAVFGDQLLAAFDQKEHNRDYVTSRLGDLLQQLVATGIPLSPR